MSDNHFLVSKEELNIQNSQIDYEDKNECGGILNFILKNFYGSFTFEEFYNRYIENESSDVCYEVLRDEIFRILETKKIMEQIYDDVDGVIKLRVI